MYLIVTKHFKGRFPVDMGGVTFAGYGQKEVENDFGARCAAQNFPMLVPCTITGKYLVDVPAVQETVVVLVPQVKAEPAPKSEEFIETEVDTHSQQDEVHPSIEIGEEPKKAVKKGK